jgi:hypothetical protein
MKQFRYKFINNSLLAAMTLLLFPLAESNGQLQTARIFNNGMVLQRETDIPVWGTSAAGATIIVTLNGNSDTVLADNEGKWKVNIPAMGPGGPFEMTISNGSQTITRSNVYVGDVYLAAGQSNMEMALSQSDGGAAEIASANNQTIRQFKIPKAVSTELAGDVPSASAWTPATASYAGNFSAVGYYFAKFLQDDIDVPIGIINASYGGARIEAYMSDEMLGFDETFVSLANGEYERQPTLIYNAMIYPLLQVPLKGVLWYQAESNADNLQDAMAYCDIFKKMINAYRDLWVQSDLPFLWIQLPNYGTAATESQPGTWDVWPQVRAGQSRALSLANTGEVTTIDVGAVDIHPTNKEPVGYRLSLVARKVIYDEDIVYSGPRYKTHELLENGQVKIKFDHVGSGLVATDSENDSVRWFSIAGADGNLVSAKAVLDGDSVLVWSDEVTNPAIIRYAWEYNPVNVNLYNAEELPAVPFMIDVIYPGYEVTYFTTSETVLERGSGALLSWKVHGASSIILNDEPVDSIGGRQVWPADTALYTLITTNKLDENDKDTLEIEIAVIDPLPTISVSTDMGDVIEPGTEITISAEAEAPGGGTVEVVEFFIDGILLFADYMAPYETTWTPPAAGEYAITAAVTDANGATVESVPLHLLVTNVILLIYEAEDAAFTGDATVMTSSAASGNKYLDLKQTWTLTFSGVNVDSAGEYPLHIRYLLNYESPKNQKFFLNGVSMGEIAFTAPNNSTWMTYRTNVTLNEGDNELRFESSWGWMSIDYIAIAIQDTGGVDALDHNRFSGLPAMTVNPNPFSQSTDIEYIVPEKGYVLLEVVDISGKQVARLVDQVQEEGQYRCLFSPGKLTDGIYLAKFNYNSSVILVKRMVLSR